MSSSFLSDRRPAPVPCSTCSTRCADSASGCVQAVHDLYDFTEGPEWGAAEDRLTRVVIIGRNLSQSALLESLQRACDAAGGD